MDGARGVLFNVIGGPDLTMSEVDEAAKIISQAADPDANIIFGATIDDGMRDQLKITVIATGFDSNTQHLREFVSPYRNDVTSSYTPPAQQPSQPINPMNQNTSSHNNPPMPTEAPKEEEKEDVWDIPAFLRQKN